MAKLLDIEGIGPVYAEKLQKAGVRSVEALLKLGATPKEREALAEKAGIDKTLILEWVNRADLFRIKGIAEEYSTCWKPRVWILSSSLPRATRKNLLAKILEVNKIKKLVRRVPYSSQN
jgi:hypothetical protein